MARRKEITIFQKENPPISLVDDDEIELEKYVESLAGFMHLNNISVLQTPNTAVIIRPSQISSIVVRDEEVFEPPTLQVKIPQKTSIPKSKTKKPEPKKEEVDIITDAD